MSETARERARAEVDARAPRGVVRSSLERTVAELADEARARLLALSLPAHEARPRPDGEPLRVLFTIDTEISMGGASRNPALRPVGPRRRIWGETKEGPFGIARFMDVFDEHGQKGVFFFEPVARAVVDPHELEDAARYIVERGHDVELHVHPEFEVDLPRVQRGELRGPSANLFDHPLADQRRYIRESAACLTKWTGRPPVAFRAGGYSASELTLEALAAEGIGIDSSYSRWAIQEGYCGMMRTPPLNDVALLDPGIVEVPVTNLWTRGVRSGLRPLELSALSVSEMIAALELLWASGARTACAVTHSFRLVRSTDIQYTDPVPDRVNLHRVRALCRWLARHPDRYRVETFRTLPLERWRPALPRAEAAVALELPTPPAWSSLVRLAVQAVKDRGAV